MTATLLERDAALDLSDLDLLDEPGKHLACAHCSPGGPGPALGLCGKRFYAQGVPVYWDDDLDADVCPPCAELFSHACPRCGRG